MAQDARRIRTSRRTRGRSARLIGWSLLVLVAIVVVAGLGYVGWTFSTTILVPQPYGLLPEFEIAAVASDTVTLPLPPNDRQFADTRKGGVVNLLWEGGTGSLGEILEEGPETLVRRFELLRGELPAPGAPARLDNHLYRGLDPESAHGLAFEDLTLPGEAGGLHAWWLPAEADTAVLMLHGRRRADLTETLRLLPVLVGEGYPVLALAYRNHDASSPSPDGFYHYGASEWRDVVTGLAFLKEAGYARVAIFAYSYGSAATLEAVEALRADPGLADVELVALVLDSPFLDPREVFRQGARNMGLPLAERIADLAMVVARLRAGIDWGELDQRRSAAALTVPLLLIHGAEDQTIPVVLADAFTRDYGGPVSFQRVAGADHTEPWNVDPEAYEGWVKAFLAEHAPLE